MGDIYWVQPLWYKVPGGFICAFHQAALGLNPKHIIYAFWNLIDLLTYTNIRHLIAKLKVENKLKMPILCKI